MSRFMSRKTRSNLIAAEAMNREAIGRQSRLHEDLVQLRERLDTTTAELAKEQRRLGFKEDHYRRQDDDASQLAVQNRLLLEA